jgi:hypothetical protein
MKTTIIELEEHDDILTVHDRLTWAKSPRVVLVWPNEGRILTRLLDLVLLQRAGRQQGLQLGLVTRDPEVMEHARELGISVFRNQKRALRGVWRRKPLRMRLLRPRRNIPPPPEELRKLLPDRSFHPMPWFWRAVFFSLGLIAIFTLIMFFIPAATITLPVEKSTQQMDVSVWLSPELTGTTLTGGVPVSVDKVVVEDEGEISATGKMSVPDHIAAGKVVFTNLTDAAVTIPKGTVVLTITGEPFRYITTQATSLKAGSGQTVTVEIEAQKPGKASNTGASTIRAVEGGVGLQAAVDNPEPVSGGTDRTETAPSKADEARLRQELSERMTQKAAEWLRGFYVEGAYTIQQSVTEVQVLEEERIPAVGQPGDTLHLRLKVEYQGWVVKGANLQTVASNVMDASLPEGMTGVENTMLLMIGNTVTPEDNGFRWVLTAKRQIAPVVDAERIIAQVLGKNRKQALEILEQEYSFHEEPIILVSPTWWPWLPMIQSQIRVEVK